MMIDIEFLKSGKTNYIEAVIGGNFTIRKVTNCKPDDQTLRQFKNLSIELFHEFNRRFTSCSAEMSIINNKILIRIRTDYSSISISGVYHFLHTDDDNHSEIFNDLSRKLIDCITGRYIKSD